MFIDVTQELALFGTAVFVLGWLLSSINGWLRARRKSRRQDPKDSRIRALEAELRIAQRGKDTALAELEESKKALEESSEGNSKRDAVITHQQSQIDKLNADLKESVLKTRQLRNELSEKATESIRSEARLREVKTELEIAQASSDLYATGVLDYNSAVETED
jgi:chromosome segregation ATPase